MRTPSISLRAAKALRSCIEAKRLFASQVLQIPNVEQADDKPSPTFRFDDLDVTLQPPHLRQPKPDGNLQFGKHFADHMFECLWTIDKGWMQPKISPLHAIQLHPAAKVFHYAQELFEGMKAFKGADGRIRLFRPEMNIRRLLNSAQRLSLPQFSPDEFLKCLIRLIHLDREWVPDQEMSSLYIRPTFIGTEPALGVCRSNEAFLYIITGPVSSYYSTGVKPVSLLADPRFVRAWPGGTGNIKLGCNYAPTLAVQQEAERQQLQQVLWLFGEEEQITEVGAMNVFMLIQNKDGSKELITAPLNTGLILPGVTRQSVLDLAREWNEFKVTERVITMKELTICLKEGRLLEMFGCGTACVISPIERIVYRGTDELLIPTMTHDSPLFRRIMTAIINIQYGVTRHPWSLEID